MAIKGRMKKLLALAVSASMALGGAAGGVSVGRIYEASAADHGISSPRKDGDGYEWDIVRMGSYPQSTTLVKEKIKWRILSIEGDDALVISDESILCLPYNTTAQSTTWQTCTLRNYLNNDFYDAAFSDTEKTAIKSTVVENADNRYYGTYAGVNTVDKVYLLSEEEAANVKYGFYQNYTRYSKATDKAVLDGCYTYRSTSDTLNFGSCKWWLRTPGKTKDSASYVDCIGEDYYYGEEVEMEDVGVRPVMHVDLSSVYVAYAGEVNSSGKVTRLYDGYNDPVVTASGTTWDCVYIGEYYQGTTSNKEDIEWRVISVEGNDAMLMAEHTLDCKSYNDDGTYSTWENSSLRTWLNEDFYNTAFKKDEQAAIITAQFTSGIDEPTQTSQNQNQNQIQDPNAGQGGQNANEDDQEEEDDYRDKVYILSNADSLNSKFGFSTANHATDLGKWCQPTDYARVNGCYIFSSDSSKAFYGNGYFWLSQSVDHTPLNPLTGLPQQQNNANQGANNNTTAINSIYVVDYDGWVDANGMNYDGLNGVRPVIHVDLSMLDLMPVRTVSTNTQKTDSTSGDESTTDTDTTDTDTTDTDTENTDTETTDTENTDTENTDTASGDGETENTVSSYGLEDTFLPYYNNTPTQGEGSADAQTGDGSGADADDTEDTRAGAKLAISRKSVRYGKKQAVTVTVSSGTDITITAKNARAKNKKYVTIVRGLSKQIKFSKKAKKGTYKFKATSAESDNYKKASKTFSIKCK